MTTALAASITNADGRNRRAAGALGLIRKNMPLMTDAEPPTSASCNPYDVAIGELLHVDRLLNLDLGNEEATEV